MSDTANILTKAMNLLPSTDKPAPAAPPTSAGVASPAASGVSPTPLAEAELKSSAALPLQTPAGASASSTPPAADSQTPKTAPANSQEKPPSYNVRMPDQVKMEESKVAPGYRKPIPEQTLVEWDAPARPFRKHKKQFYRMVIFIALLICLIFFFAQQILPVAVVISVAFLVYVSSVVPPHDLHYKLTNYGLYVDKDAYAWYEMLRFWFDEKAGQQVLNIDIVRFPNRLTLVLLPNQTPSQEDFTLVLSEVILQEKAPLSTFEKVSQWLEEKIPLE